MNKTAVSMFVITVLLAALAYYQGGQELVADGLKAGWGMLSETAVLLILAFMAAGLIQTLISHDMITRWLGKESGWKGIILASAVGGIIPGGPYVYYPIASSFLNAGAEMGTLIAFVSAKSLWDIARLPMEAAILGPKLTLIRNAVTFFFPFIVGFMGNVLFKKTADKIREERNKGDN
ncbi:MAG: permease [Firmicutes bacterium HGW-Firmicutes-13]|nr:MAG: permease [Firmicutes bacterium HGW-Firmicutes-13]